MNSGIKSLYKRWSLIYNRKKDDALQSRFTFRTQADSDYWRHLEGYSGDRDVM